MGLSHLLERTVASGDRGASWTIAQFQPRWMNRTCAHNAPSRNVTIAPRRTALVVRFHATLQQGSSKSHCLK